MLALVKYGYGKGETELRDIQSPVIDENDLLIEVKAAGICASDLAFDNGGLQSVLRPPVVLGHEFSGIVSKIGSKVKDWNIGDRVVSDNTGYVCGKCYACSTSDYLSCKERLGIGYGMDGGFTQFVKIPGQILSKNPNCLFRIPENVTFEEAAILDPCCNAYKAVIQEAHFLPGESIAIFGVGALGLFSIQVARVAGAVNIISIGKSSNSERFKTALKIGATNTIEANKEDVVAKIREITEGEGVSTVIDCAGPSDVLKNAIGIVRNGGNIIKIGYDPNPLGFSIDSILDKGINIKGHFGYDYVSWRNCINLVQCGKIDMKSLISHRLPLSKWKEGFELARNRQAVKVILTYE